MTDFDLSGLSREQIIQLQTTLSPKWTKYIPITPTPKQTAALLMDDVKELLYGGAAGGGKSVYLLAAMNSMTGKTQCSSSMANVATAELKKGVLVQPNLTASISFRSAVEGTLPGRISCPPVDVVTAVEEIARCLHGSEPKSSGMLAVKRSW